MQSQTWSPPRPEPRLPAPTMCAPPGVTLSYAAGEPIYLEGDPVHSLYAVASGAVRTVRHSIEGRRQIGGFYYPGDLFGLDAEKEHAFSAEAMCPAEVKAYRLGSDETGTSAELAALPAALAELTRAHRHLAMLGRRSAGEKVASFLLDMARTGGADVANLPMSRQDMADYLGLAIETVSRVLGQFQAEGIVDFASCRDFHVVRGTTLHRLAAS